MPTWDRVTVLDWSHAVRPQPYVLSVSTMGCRCCSDGETIFAVDAAITTIREYIQDRQEEIEALQATVARIIEKGEIVP